MGLRLNFVCPICGYSVCVEGGVGHGFYSTFKTFKCNDCKIVVDIWIESKAKEDAFKISSPSCPECKSDNLSSWTEGDARCPKCETKMIIDRSSFTFWD